jgi:carbon monoxide dehydrogenase subunit G
MIETEQSVAIRASLSDTWNYARDIRRWAALVPGMQDCTVIDDDNSRWVVKVGVGGLVRTVTVDVHVECWDGPGTVDFTYRLKGDPVTGGGKYRAVADGDGTTVLFALRVEGGGPMAPMWEAMGRPLLPQLARGFAEQFRDAVEQATGVSPVDRRKKSIWARFAAWLRGLFGKGEKRT